MRPCSDWTSGARHKAPAESGFGKRPFNHKGARCAGVALDQATLFPHDTLPTDVTLHACLRLLPPAVRVVEISSNDAWMRDAGPTFVVNDRGGLRGVDWTFNAWGGLDGGLYFPWDRDDAVAQKVLEIERCDRYRAPFVLEANTIPGMTETSLLPKAAAAADAATRGRPGGAGAGAALAPGNPRRA